MRSCPSLAPRLDSCTRSWRRQGLHPNSLGGTVGWILGGIVRGGGRQAACFIFILIVHPARVTRVIPFIGGCPCAVAVELVCAARCLKSSLFILTMKNFK